MVTVADAAGCCSVCASSLRSSPVTRIGRVVAACCPLPPSSTFPKLRFGLVAGPAMPLLAYCDDTLWVEPIELSDRADDAMRRIDHDREYVRSDFSVVPGSVALPASRSALSDSWVVGVYGMAEESNRSSPSSRWIVRADEVTPVCPPVPSCGSSGTLVSTINTLGGFPGRGMPTNGGGALRLLALKCDLVEPRMDDRAEPRMPRLDTPRTETAWMECFDDETMLRTLAIVGRRSRVENSA